MGKGIDAAREHAPEHAAVLDDFKDQLLIAFLRRLGAKTKIPIEEIDETGNFLLAFKVEGRSFRFELLKKS